MSTQHNILYSLETSQCPSFLLSPKTFWIKWVQAIPGWAGTANFLVNTLTRCCFAFYKMQWNVAEIADRRPKFEQDLLDCAYLLSGALQSKVCLPLRREANLFLLFSGAVVWNGISEMRWHLSFGHWGWDWNSVLPKGLLNHVFLVLLYTSRMSVSFYGSLPIILLKLWIKMWAHAARGSSPQLPLSREDPRAFGIWCSP